MAWEQFEVWSVDEDGFEQLVESTRSLKQAKIIAQQTLTEGAVDVIIYREINESLKEVERLHRLVDNN